MPAEAIAIVAARDGRGQAQGQEQEQTGSIRASSRPRRLPPDFERAPDGQLRYADTRHPPFFLEVAYSQRDKSLRDEVKGLFERLLGEVCTVIGVHIEYANAADCKVPNHAHAASVSLWASELQRTEADEETELSVHLVQEEELCDHQRRAAQEAVTITFSFFLPLEVSQKQTLPFTLISPLLLLIMVTHSLTIGELQLEH